MLTMLHTSPLHRATFDTLRDEIAPGTALFHIVREDFLARAQACGDAGVSTELADEITQTIRAVNGPVICTCTTIGEIAVAAGAIRIDQPMMRAAAEVSGPILMAYCLDSTLRPSLDLLEAEHAEIGLTSDITSLFLGEFWPLFEAGETDAFIATIAAAIKHALRKHPDIACVVLAQASMANAAPILQHIDIPVLASPELALMAGLGI